MGGSSRHALRLGAMQRSEIAPASYRRQIFLLHFGLNNWYGSTYLIGMYQNNTGARLLWKRQI